MSFYNKTKGFTLLSHIVDKCLPNWSDINGFCARTLHKIFCYYCQMTDKGVLMSAERMLTEFTKIIVICILCGLKILGDKAGEEVRFSR